MGRKRQRREKLNPFYDLDEVKEMVEKGKVYFHDKALDGARDSFGWGQVDIKDALLRLERKHFHKSEVSKFNAWLVLDFYKARGLKEEDVYTHFYIDTKIGLLIVNSFKEI